MRELQGQHHFHYIRKAMYVQLILPSGQLTTAEPFLRLHLLLVFTVLSCQLS